MNIRKQTIRIVLAEDHKIIREGLKSLIEAHPNMAVIGEAETGRAAIDLAEQLSPEVIIMDITMPELNGIDATRHITSTLPNIRVIALSMHTDRRMIGEMMRAGAAGFLLKESAFEELARAIMTVTIKGNIYLSPKIAGCVLEDFSRRPPGGRAVATEILSQREREVLQLIAEGYSTKEAADKLGVSTKTIESHRKNLMEKMDCHSIAELTKIAIREGLTSLE